jgi:hypothetical protein
MRGSQGQVFANKTPPMGGFPVGQPFQADILAN